MGKCHDFSYYHHYMFVYGIEVLYACLIYWFNVLIETLAMLFRAYPCARGIKSTTSYIFHDAMDVSLVWVMLSIAELDVALTSPRLAVYNFIISSCFVSVCCSYMV